MISGAQFYSGLIALYPAGTTSSNMSSTSLVSGTLSENTTYVLGAKYTLPSTDFLDTGKNFIFQADLYGTNSTAESFYFDTI